MTTKKKPDAVLSSADMEEANRHLAALFCLSAVGGNIQRVNGAIEILTDLLNQVFTAGAECGECWGSKEEITINWEVQHKAIAIAHQRGLYESEIQRHIGEVKMGYGNKSIKDWAEDTHALAVKQGWWDDYKPSKVTPLALKMTTDEVLAKLMLITSEVAEACEEARKIPAELLHEVLFREPGVVGTPESGISRDSFKQREGRWPDEKDKPVGFAIELADIVIRVFDTAEALGIDIQRAIETKHYHNETRQRRHGGKLA